MKYLLFCLLVTRCLAGGWIICTVRASDGAVSWHSDRPTSDTAQIGPLPEGASWLAVPKSQWTADAAELLDGVPVYAISEGRVVNREAKAVEQERTALDRSKSAKSAVEIKAKALAAEALLKDDPTNAALLAEKAALDKQSADATALTTATK